MAAELAYSQIVSSSSPTLRGLGASDGARLLDPNRVTSESFVIRPGFGGQAPTLGQSVDTHSDPEEFA